MKVIFSGLESSGKSLKLAKTVAEIAYRNSKWKKRSGQTRPIASNLEFSPQFHEHVTKELEIPIVYWTNVEELIKMHDCDVVVDEVGNYFDSRLWADLSLDARRWLSQGAKTGIEMYGSAQDFAQVDKAFRRLVNHLFHITKVMGSRRPSPTKPPVTRIWGLCLVRELDPQGYDEDKKKFANGSAIPSFFTIRRQDCEIFDTTQKIIRSLPTPLRHEERFCERHNDAVPCSFHKIIHV